MNGWGFRQTSKRFDGLGYDATWWELYRATRFSSFKLAMGYVNDVAGIAKSEKHHPTILIHNRVNVDISLDTHDTVERAAISSNGRSVTAQWPGLTARDLRMATLISPLLVKHGAIVDPVPPKIHIPTFAKLLNVRISSD
ncbi:hypothetical protein FRC08_010763 [Ceratobasidium sp. 394]|nr:hypothetical protein FRC08_010763 [Ceratobasidium sp. 394]